MTPAKSEREKAHIEELLNAGAAELAERMKSTGSPPMVPAEAVEAAAKIWQELDRREGYGEYPISEYTEDVSAMLEAAAPYIRADALLDAADDVAIRGDIISKNNGGMDAWDYLRARAETEKGKL